MRQGSPLSFHFLKAIYIQCGPCETVTKINRYIYASQTVPSDLRFKPIEIFLYTPSKTLNDIFKRSKIKDDYNKTLVTEMYLVCHITDTIQYMKFGLHFYKTNCCLSNVHKRCFNITLKMFIFVQFVEKIIEINMQ